MLALSNLLSSGESKSDAPPENTTIGSETNDRSTTDARAIGVRKAATLLAVLSGDRGHCVALPFGPEIVGSPEQPGATRQILGDVVKPPQAPEASEPPSKLPMIGRTTAFRSTDGDVIYVNFVRGK
jgi:hypothetical protein